MVTTFQTSAAFKLHQATLLIDRIADQYLTREHGIHYAPFLVLLMVRVLDQPSQQQIAAALGVSRASVTQRAAALTERGLIEVRKHRTDARTNVVALTASGAELVERGWAGLERHQDGLDEGVDESALTTQLDRIITNGIRILGL